MKAIEGEQIWMNAFTRITDRYNNIKHASIIHTFFLLFFFQQTFVINFHKAICIAATAILNRGENRTSSPTQSFYQHKNVLNKNVTQVPIYDVLQTNSGYIMRDT